MKDDGRYRLFLISAIFLLSFLVRLLYLHQISDGPFARVVYLDALRYDSWAESLAFGTADTIEPFFRAPFYPIFLAGIYKVFGHDLYAARLIQMLLGSASAVFIFLLAERLFGRTVAVISSLSWAFYGPAVYWAGEILIVTLIIFLDLLLMYLVLISFSRPHPVKWLSAGLVLGLSAIARPNILVFAPFVVLLVLFSRRPDTGSDRSTGSRLLWALLFVAGVAAPIASVTFNNYRKTDDFILISSQGGINFFMGNNEKADGKTAATPERGGVYGKYLDNAWVSSVRIAESVEGRKMKPSEVSGFWYREGMKFVRGNPAAWLRLMAKKLGYFWSGIEVTNNEDIYYFRKYSSVLGILMWRRVIAFPFGIVGPLALLGLFLTRKRWRRLLPVTGFIFIYMMSVILFFVCARYRMPVIPFLLMFAAYAVSWLVENVTALRWKSALPTVGAVMMLAILFNSGIGAVMDRNRAQACYLAGWAYHQEGKFDQAQAEYEKAAGFFPRHLQVHNNLGLIYAKKGNFPRAINEFRKAVDINPMDAMAHFYLGTAYMSAEKYDKAAETYEHVLELDPTNEIAALRAGNAYYELHRPDEAVKKWLQCLSINPNNAKARARLAVVESGAN